MKFITWINSQVDWLKSFFSEPDGKGSFRRLGGSIIIYIFIQTYQKVSIVNNKMEDIPEFWVVTILTILGYNIIDKVLSRYVNSKTEKPNDNK